MGRGISHSSSSARLRASVVPNIAPEIAFREKIRLRLQNVSDQAIDLMTPPQMSSTLMWEYWEEALGELLKKEFGKDVVFRNSEYINTILAANPDVTDYEERLQLLGNAAERRLLTYSTAVQNMVKNWTPDKPVKDMRDDTADWVLMLERPVIIDVKSMKVDAEGKSTAQVPNLVSGSKISDALSLAHRTKDCKFPEIWYIGIDWTPKQSRVMPGKCVKSYVMNLLQENPKNMLINHHNNAVQFKTGKALQDFKKDDAFWGKEFQKQYRKMLSRQRKAIKERYRRSFHRDDTLDTEVDGDNYRPVVF